MIGAYAWRMKRLLFIAMICLPAAAPAGELETAMAYNSRVIQIQNETDNAVRWIDLHGYNDRVAYQFIRRCGWLIAYGGSDWCHQSTAHRALIGTAYQQGSSRTVRLVKQYTRL